MANDEIGCLTITSLTPRYNAIDASSINTVADAGDEHEATSVTSDYSLKSDTGVYTITKE